MENHRHLIANQILFLLEVGMNNTIENKYCSSFY